MHGCHGQGLFTMENVVIMPLLIALDIVFQESSFNQYFFINMVTLTIQVPIPGDPSQNPSGYILELQYYICSSDGPVCAFFVCYSFTKIEVQRNQSERQNSRAMVASSKDLEKPQMINPFQSNVSLLHPLKKG